MAEAPVPSNLQESGLQESLAALDRAAPLLSLLGVASDGLTDTMVERTVSNLTRVSMLLDRLASPGVERLVAQVSDPNVVEGLGSILQRLDQLQSVLAAVGAFNDGLTDTMVERTVSNLTRVSMLLDRLTGPGVEQLVAQVSDPKVAEGLGGMLQRLDQLQGLVAAVGALSDGLTDSMLERTMSNLTRASLLLDRLTSPGVERLIAQVSDPKVAEGLGGLLERAEQLQGLLGAVGALSDGLTDTMVERTVRNLTQVMALLDRLSAPGGEALVDGLLEAGPAVGTVLEKLSDLEASGRLERMLGLMDMLGVLADSLTEPMLERMIAFLTGLMEMASDSGGLTSQLRRISQEATAEAQRDTRSMGVVGMLGSLKDPEVQQGLKVLLALTKRMPDVLNRS